MKKRILPLLLSLSLLSGCGGSAAVRSLSPPDGTVPPVEAARACEADAAYGSFSLNLLRSCRTEGENILISPLSVTLALGMTANGAGGDTRAAFETLFGMDLDALNALCAALLADYGALGGSSQTVLADSLWADPDVTLEDAFLRRAADPYDAQLFQADLQNPATVKALNQWVSDATRGLIPKTVDQFSSNTVLALVNAVYLKNRFLAPFPEPHSAWTLDFTAEDGAVTQPCGMNNGERQEQYIDSGNGQGVVLPYDDGQLGLLLMLPEEGLSLTDYLSGWDSSTIPALLEARTERRVDLTMPKFEAAWSGSLREPLSDLGLAGAFTREADFSAMGHSENGALYLSEVIHKTVLKVNEKGTEAAAVTMVEADCGAAMPQDLIQLRLDRPFVYTIVDLEHGTPLFLGTLEQGA